jgi:SAM-dependent methyltransferase
MPTGTLVNLSHSGFVRTPPAWAERIVRNLLQFGARANVFDPTAGEGDLLAPCAALPGAHLYGVEISRERAAVARERLPQLTLVTSAIEAVRVTPGSMDLVLCNPPYFFEDGRRAEYRILADAGATLCPGGILIAIIPARSAWDGTMINHWCKHYERIRCWKFPDGDANDDTSFQKYTQIVVVGVRRQMPLKAPEILEQQRLAGWRWRQPKKAESPWGQGTPPPELPDHLIADPYRVPDDGRLMPELVTLNADEATLLEALARSGVQRTAEWARATTFQAEQQAEQPIMPPTGEAHLAAEILTGLLDGEVLAGPDGQSYVFVTCVSQQWVRVQLDEETLERERERGNVHVEVQQQEDHPILGMLQLATGEVQYHQGEDVFAFLTPWLARLANRVLEKRQPLYRLDPADWELEVCAQIGLDKQLQGADYPGLVPPQLHRVFAMGAALDARGRVAIQGEPGTGKTRQSTAVMARQAALWQQYRSGQRHGTQLPVWVARLRQAWQTTPRAERLLGPTRRLPTALPVLVTTPKRVTPTWQQEITSAWPQAEVFVIESYLDIDRWMQRCVDSQAPAVIGIVSHSQSRAFGRQWVPAVIERMVRRRVPDLEPPEELREQVEPLIERGHIIGYRLKGTEELLTNVEEVNSFFCPDCGARVEGQPYGHRIEAKAKATPVGEDGHPSDSDEDTVEPVTNRGWFEQKPRWCRICHLPHGERKEDQQAERDERASTRGALWMEARVPGAARKAPQVAFATWATGAEATAKAACQTAGQKPPPELRLPEGRPSLLALQPGTPSKDPTRREHHPLSGWRLGKANRTPGVRIPADRLRIIDAVGTHAGAAPESFSPYEYLARFYRGCVALVVVDESHNARSRSTDIAHSIHLAQLASQTTVYASGTHYGGCLDDLFWYWYRFNPRFWHRLGLGWNDVEEAIGRFGVIQQWTREHEGEARRGSGQTDITVTTVPSPGISARLLPFLLGDLVFLSVLDVGAHMPPRLEVPEIVSMVDPALEAQLIPAKAAWREAEEALEEARKHLDQCSKAGSATPPEELATAGEDHRVALALRDEAKATLEEVERWVEARDLAGNHDGMVRQLRDLAVAGNSAAALAQGTIPRWWAALPCVEPLFTVEQTKRGKWGEALKKELLLTAPRLSADYLYPLEVHLKELVAARLKARQRVMVYYEQNGLRSMAERLAWVLREYQPWALANSVEAEDREDAIKRAVLEGGHRVVLVPYRRVMEGLNLQQAIDVVIWYEMALNLFYLDQASRRHWRLGRREPAEIIYLAYAGSAAHRKLCKLASESGAAAAFAGEPAKGALVEHVGAHKTMLARLSSTLEALAEAGEPEETPLADGVALKAAFARRAEELAATLKAGRQWLGLVDRLPVRLAEFHAQFQAIPAESKASSSEASLVAAERAPIHLIPPAKRTSVAPGLPATWTIPDGMEPEQARSVPLGTEGMPEPLVITPKAVVVRSLWEEAADTAQEGAPTGAASMSTPIQPTPPKMPADTLAHAMCPPITSDTSASARPVPPLHPHPPLVRSTQPPQRTTNQSVPEAQAAPIPHQGTIAVEEHRLVLRFPNTGIHLETIRRLSRTYRGRFDWNLKAWVLPLGVTKESLHVVDAVLDAFPMLQEIEEARQQALEQLLTQVRQRYVQLNGRLPDEHALRQQVQTCSEAQRWLRTIERKLAEQPHPALTHGSSSARSAV